MNVEVEKISNGWLVIERSGLDVKKTFFSDKDDAFCFAIESIEIEREKS